MTDGERPAAAFILSLVGGVLILVAGLFGLVAWTAWGRIGYWGGWGWMMRPWMMGWWMPWAWAAFSLIGLVSGIIIIVGAVMLQSRPAEAQTWGVLILVFSVISIFGTGGFVLGAILGIIGGILALTWK